MATGTILQHRLNNGLKIIGEVNPASKSSAIGFFVKTGSRDETPKEAGVSHFLEHMMFKGTPNRSALELTYDLGRIGAQANAFTSEENTVYYAAVLPEYFREMHTILADMLRPALDPAEFATEKNVILEEIALYQDRPQFYLFERAAADYYGRHPAGNSVLGSTDSISALTQPEMRAYFERRYAPGNMVLVGAGNFDWELFLADAERLSGGWQEYAAPRDCPVHRTTPLMKEYRKKGITQSHVVFLTEGAHAQEDERFALGVLALVLGDSTGSKLYWELVDPGLAESADADNDERDGTGAFMAYAATSPDKLDLVAEKMRKIISAPLDFTVADLERAKTKVISKMVLGGELPMGRMMGLGMSWNARRHVQPLRDVIDRVKAITREEIERTVARYPLATWSEFRLVGESA
jgi:predicted Zn-dependent peptidase